MKFKKELENIAVYEAGKPIELIVREYGIAAKNVVKIASNENPYGTSKKVQKTLKDSIKKANLYPDDSYYELKDALAHKYSVTSKNIIIGAGSDQIIEFCVNSLCSDKDSVLCAGVTFAMYDIYSRIAGAKVIKTTSKEHNLDEFMNLYKKHKPKIIFLCIPNNPLGECLDAIEVERFVSQISSDTLVLLDGAYQEFATYKDKSKALDPKMLISKYKNVIYLGTFSKVYGLGGMRVGYGIADESIINALHKIRPPFNITTLSLAAAITALKDRKFIDKTLKKNLKEMKRYERFAKKLGFSTIPSYTNFITFLCDDNAKYGKLDATLICDFLLKKGMIIRNLKSYSLNAFRVTIGTKDQNDRFFMLLGMYLKDK